MTDIQHLTLLLRVKTLVAGRWRLSVTGLADRPKVSRGGDWGYCLGPQRMRGPGLPVPSHRIADWRAYVVSVPNCPGNQGTSRPYETLPDSYAAATIMCVGQKGEVY